MKIKEIKQSFLSSLTPFAQQNGFKISKTRFCLGNKNERCECQFSFDYSSWVDEVHLFPYAQIKISAIHTICDINDFHLNYTAFINLFVLKKICDGIYTDDTKWKLQYNKQDRFVICNDCDLKSAENEMVKLLPIGLEYLALNNSIPAIDKMYNTPPIGKPNPNCSGLDTQCFLGLISAKLANNPDYKQISKCYSKIMASEDILPDTITKFERIKNFLETKY